MKRRIWFLCSLLLLSPLLLAGCGGKSSGPSPYENNEPSPYEEVNTLDGIWIEVKEDTVTPTGLEFVFHNTTDRNDYFYGLWYTLEVYHNEQWLTVNPLPGRGELTAPSVGNPVLTQEELEQADGRPEWWGYPPNERGYDWEGYYGALPPGKYRVVTYIFALGSDPMYYLTASFSIE